MIDNAALQTLLETRNDFSVVAEVYNANSVPSANGFDPVNALGTWAAVDGITFRGVEYQPLVQSFGRISKSMTESVGTCSVTFSNLTREAAQFEFGNGFEGMILVVRLLSRGASVALSDSQVLFVGRCERPLEGDKEELTVTAKHILGSLDVLIPRRNYGPEDFKGRTQADPEFEGFPNMPLYGTTSYNRIEKRGGFLGWWNKKEVRATMQWSTYSDADSSKMVAECFGRVQIQGVNIGAADVGTQVRMRIAFCEGPVQDIVNARTTDPALPLNPTSYDEALGLVGELNGPDDPSWPGVGLHSRTVHIRCQADNSAMDVSDPAPDVVAVIEGKIITTPDASGGWNT